MAEILKTKNDLKSTIVKSVFAESNFQCKLRNDNVIAEY